MKVNDICPECETERLVDDPDNPGKWLVCNECGNYVQITEIDNESNE